MGFFNSLFGSKQPATTAANATSQQQAVKTANVPSQKPATEAASVGSAQNTSHQQGGTSMNVDMELDARGLNCPLPILKTKKALAGMASGQVLKVISTDCGSVKDMESFSSQTGNPLLEQAENDGEYTFFMQKK